MTPRRPRQPAFWISTPRPLVEWCRSVAGDVAKALAGSGNPQSPDDAPGATPANPDAAMTPRQGHPKPEDPGRHRMPPVIDSSGQPPHDEPAS